MTPEEEKKIREEIKRLVGIHGIISKSTYFRLRRDPLLEKRCFWWCKSFGCQTCDNIQKLRIKLYPHLYKKRKCKHKWVFINKDYFRCEHCTSKGIYVNGYVVKEE